MGVASVAGMVRPTTSAGRRGRLAVALLVGALVLGGCVTSGDDSSPGERAMRVEEVTAARAAVAEPVPALVSAAESFAEGLRLVRAEEGASSEARAVAAETLGSAALEAAAATVDDLELPGDGPDVVAAQEVLDQLVAAAAEVLAAASTEVDELRTLADFDGSLAQLVATWDEPAARTDARESLDAAAIAADALRAEAAGATAVVACLDVWSHRAEAATTVASRSAELRDLVGGSTGLEYDDRRDEWRPDPYGLGGPPATLDDDLVAGCWGEESPTALAAARLPVLLDDLVGVLDPEDLAG